MVVSNFALRGSGIEHLEVTAAALVTVIQALERQRLVVILATVPPTLLKGELLRFSRNACIRSIVGTRPLLDFETRWLATGPALAAAWYSDPIHASVAGEIVEAEMATTLLLTLVK